MRLKSYLQNCQLDLRLFFFLLVLMAVYRMIFMAKYAGAMGADTLTSDIIQANLTGLRLSLKSAGGFTLFSFLLVTLPSLVNPRLYLGRMRLVVGAVACFLLTVLFLARFPYYEEFRMTYGMQVFQGWHDDKVAIVGMMMTEYHLLPGLLAALALAAGLAWLLKKFLGLPLWQGDLRHPYLGAAGALLVTVLFMFLCRFGGGVSYDTGINWENAAVTGDDFLNECVLDDVQAIYRALQQEKRMQAGDIYGVDKKLAEGLTAAQVEKDISRTAAGAKINKPRHIFIILGETWSQWPMLEKYASLHAAEGIKSLIASPNAYYTSHFMSNGDFTAVAITGLITGLSEVNVMVNYQPRSFEEIYPTAMAIPFHKLGYKVDFWYGGTPGWDNISRLALAQGFDDFYGYPDFHAPKTNSWGTNDRNLFNALAAHLDGEEPTVHLIMTTSNHPPYNVDLEAEGFDVAKAEQQLREILPDEHDPHNLAIELGHYYYMDKVATEFIHETEKKYPDSLFIITGDHAARSNPGAQPTLLEFQSIPFVMYGAGITPDILPTDAVGGQTGIVPTLVELIAPAGFAYASVAPPIGQYPASFNNAYYMTDKILGKIDSDKFELLPGIASADVAAEQAKTEPFLRRLRTLSYWFLKGER